MIVIYKNILIVARRRPAEPDFYVRLIIAAGCAYATQHNAYAIDARVVHRLRTVSSPIKLTVSRKRYRGPGNQFSVTNRAVSDAPLYPI
jgi:hypothetical protein